MNGAKKKWTSTYFPGRTSFQYGRGRLKMKSILAQPCLSYTVIAIAGLFWVVLSLVTFQLLPNAYSHLGMKLDQDQAILLKVSEARRLQTGHSPGCPDHKSAMGTLVHKRIPQYTISLRNPLTSSPYHILHTVTTRFMIGQPHQPILARARYMLFETFCWPTMKYQSRQNFYWIVLVDPRLDPDVIADIQTLLTSSQGNVHFPSQNAFLVLTDNTAWAADGVGVPNVTSYGVGLQDIARQYRDGDLDILSGNTYHLMTALDLLEDAKDKVKRRKIHDVKKPILLIETLLDADDGINNHGIEWIQDLAIAHSVQQQESLDLISPTLNSTWWVLCGTDHIEWHNRDIFRMTDNEYTTLGLTAGITGIRHAPIYCASAGYTRVGLTSPQDHATSNNKTSILFPQPAYSNHALAMAFPMCNATQSSGCFRREFDGKAYALKCRSITSDSMDHMTPNRIDYRDNSWEDKKEHPLLVNETESTWIVLGNEFSVSRFQAWNTSVYLRENAQEIVNENQQSHCAPGFPCRLVAQKTFKNMNKYLRMMNRKNEREKKGIILPKLIGA